MATPHNRGVPTVASPLISLCLALTFALSVGFGPAPVTASRICIVGAGIGGSALAHFLRQNATKEHDIVVLERAGRVGGRILRADVDGEFFEAGASIIHERNTHMARFARDLGLGSRFLIGLDFGIWDGAAFRVTQIPEHAWPWPLAILRNIFVMAGRYGVWNLQALGTVVTEMVDKWVLLYHDDVPAFPSPSELLAWAGLLPMTQDTLAHVLHEGHVAKLLVDEMAAAIVRIQYGQTVNITALPGVVGLFGTGRNLWQVPGGNSKIPEGLLKRSRSQLRLNTTVRAVLSSGEGEGPRYSLQLEGAEGEGEQDSVPCDVVALATPLAESGIALPASAHVRLSELRPFHHTHVTFVRGHLNESYFGLKPGSDAPGMIATVEDPGLPFVSASLQQSDGKGEQHSAPVYKVFSRQPLAHETLDALFKEYSTVVRLDWAAYPSYQPPQTFVPFLLDEHHLYYLNTFEDGASAMEAAAVAAKNVAQLILERLGDITPLHLRQQQNQDSGGSTHEEL